MQIEETLHLLPNGGDVTTSNDIEQLAHGLNHFDFIIDGTFDTDPARLAYYDKVSHPVVLAGITRTTLAGAIARHGTRPRCAIFGWNALPTLIDRPVMEVSAVEESQRPLLKEWAGYLNRELQWVNDRVGMVTPRIILMIINEACYTYQEGTASIADIDQAMQLGTRYPRGPFEWANAMGIDNVFQQLEALYLDTHDERYRAAPLLKQHYLRHQPFML